MSHTFSPGESRLHSFRGEAKDKELRDVEEIEAALAANKEEEIIKLRRHVHSLEVLAEGLRESETRAIENRNATVDIYKQKCSDLQRRVNNLESAQVGSSELKQQLLTARADAFSAKKRAEEAERERDQVEASFENLVKALKDKVGHLATERVDMARELADKGSKYKDAKRYIEKLKRENLDLKAWKERRSSAEAELREPSALRVSTRAKRDESFEQEDEQAEKRVSLQAEDQAGLGVTFSAPAVVASETPPAPSQPLPASFGSVSSPPRGALGLSPIQQEHHDALRRATTLGQQMMRSNLGKLTEPVKKWTSQK